MHINVMNIGQIFIIDVFSSELEERERVKGKKNMTKMMQKNKYTEKILHILTKKIPNEK